MNPRIRALAEQALDYANSCEAEAWDGAYERKFAELIVRECLEVVEKQLGGGNGDGVEWDRAIDFTYEDMKKHFGVEQ